jgi:hypothetical protein
MTLKIKSKMLTPKEDFQCGQERRESPRFELPIQVLNLKNQEEKVHGNLSIGGCDFLSTKDFFLGQNLNLGLQLLGMNSSLLISGEVFRISSGRKNKRVVVLLTDLDFDSQRSIARWLDLRSGVFEASHPD